MNVKVKLSGDKQITAFIKSLVPRGMKKTAMFEIAKYIIGDDKHGLKHEPPYKYITRKSAYGFTWFTEKQRRWFWANGGPDMIGNNRTGAIKNDWDFTDMGGWDRVRVFNEAPGAEWVVGDKQARQPAKVGWKRAVDTMRANMRGAIRSAQAKVNELIRRKGK